MSTGIFLSHSPPTVTSLDVPFHNAVFPDMDTEDHDLRIAGDYMIDRRELPQGFGETVPDDYLPGLEKYCETCHVFRETEVQRCAQCRLASYCVSNIRFVKMSDLY